MKELNERMENEKWAEEIKQQISTALQVKDFCKADQLNKELLDGVGYSLDFDELREDPNYED
jgi:hypothetical protein